MTITNTRPMKAAAMAYAEKNIAVFPLAAGKKIPAGGRGCLDATTDTATIEAWWNKYPRANIGIATGKINNIIVIDADRNHHEGEDGVETIRQLEKKLGSLPDTKMQLTPNGGEQYFFKHPDSFDVKNYGSKRADDPKVDRYEGIDIVGIDIRGNGGYVVAPPSTIEKNGGGHASYEWEVSSYGNDIAVLPVAWLEFIYDMEYTSTNSTASSGEPTPAPVWNGDGFDIVTEVLPHIDVNKCSYEEWSQVGMALKGLGYPCEVWDEWSSTDSTNGSDDKPRYTPGECAKKWRTFRKGEGKTLGARYLIGLAKAGGLKTQPPAPDAPYYIERAEQRSRAPLAWDGIISDRGDRDQEAQQQPEQGSTQKEAASRPAVKADLRNHPAFRIAANLRAQGVPEDKIHAQLVSYANNDCVPPMQEEQIEAIYNLVLSYPAKTKLAQMLPGKERLSRAALAEQMEAMGFGIRYNVITCEYEPLGRTEAGRVMSQDDLITLLHDALADYFKGVTFDTLNAYVTLQARENEYNPVLDTLRAVEWDGRDRLPQLFELIGIEADNLSQVLVTKWLKQSVALLFNDPADPYGADGVLVFNGEQGAGKTSLFRHLALRDAWFGEGMTVNDRDKDTTRRIVTTWIAELGEVESTLKSDISALKAFVSAAVDHYRLPYGRNDVVAPRMTSLCATCNSDRYLIDPTGNRRWWSVPFSRMIPRAELVALDALQLWAQIFAEVAPLPYHDKAACYRLTDEERAALAKRNGDYEKPLKGQPEIEDILARAERDNLPTKTLTASDWKEYWPALRPYDARQIGAALKKCGIITEERKIEGRKGRWAELPVPRNSY